MHVAKARRAKRITTEWAKLESAALPLRREAVPWDPLYRHWIMLRAIRKWCLTRQIWPHQVTEEIIARFVASKRRSTVSVRERIRARAAWNFAIAHPPGWPTSDNNERRSLISGRSKKLPSRGTAVP